MNRRNTLLGLVAAFALSPLAAIAAAGPKYDQAAFDAAQAAGKSIILHVAATWCETCEAQRKVLESLETDPKFKNLVVLVIDYDAQKDVMRKFGVTSRSTIIAFKGKDEMGRLTGNTKMPVIKALLTKAL